MVARAVTGTLGDPGRPYGRGMPTEPPARLLRRRLAGADHPDREHDGTGDTVESSADGVAEDGRSLLPRWLPDSAPGSGTSWLSAVRADPGRAGVLALGALAVVAVLVTVFTLVRSDPHPVVSAKLPPVQPISTTSSRPGPPTSAAPPADVPVVVSVVGLVRTPGLVTLAPGARVADALSAAGGPLAGADSVGLNLARRLSDGEQVLVGIAPAPDGPRVLGSSVGGGAPASAGPKPTTTAASPGPGAPLDLNSATVEQFDALPGIGPVTAAAIVAWREQNGRFTSVEQLGEVDGIGPARLDRLRELVRV